MIPVLECRQRWCARSHVPTMTNTHQLSPLYTEHTLCVRHGTAGPGRWPLRPPLTGRQRGGPDRPTGVRRGRPSGRTAAPPAPRSRPLARWGTAPARRWTGRDRHLCSCTAAPRISRSRLAHSCFPTLSEKRKMSVKNNQNQFTKKRHALD